MNNTSDLIFTILIKELRRHVYHMDDALIGRDQFKLLLQEMKNGDSEDDRKIAKEYLKYVLEEEKLEARTKHKATKKLTAYELSVKLTEMLNIGSQIAASIKGLVELPYGESYASAPPEIQRKTDNVATNLERYRKGFVDWYTETARAIARYEKNTYHLHEFMSDRNRYTIVRNKTNSPDELLADFGHHITELIKILKVLEREDTTLVINLSLHGSGRPIVTIGDEVLYFGSMRNGHAYELINYCITHRPFTSVELTDLKKIERLKLSRISNINQTLKGSAFDPVKGPLKVFVESSSHSLIVKPTINVTPDCLDRIRDESASQLGIGST